MGISRRTFLGAASAAVLGACTSSRRAAGPGSASAEHRGPAASTAPTGRAAPAAPAGPAAFVSHGPADSGRVAFTFHGSGDLGMLHDLLAAAKRLATPVTVFAVGSWLDQNPEVAGAILRDGHELANHTYTHPALGQAAASVVADEIARCRDALTRHAGSPGAWFRPSGVDVPSALILAQAGRAGYPTVVGYDIDPLDYEDPPAATIADRVAAKLHPGAIVSLHTGHAHTVAAFEPMVAAARAHGLTPVRVGDLLPR
ncbi:MAG TPA: polysaccharide deacetylase family protein [Acidimicrobiia bacterium]|nr:polysaccharide deacetylase family protein [Acidimicrobiia bacterium]